MRAELRDKHTMVWPSKASQQLEGLTSPKAARGSGAVQFGGAVAMEGATGQGPWPGKEGSETAGSRTLLTF